MTDKKTEALKLALEALRPHAEWDETVGGDPLPVNAEADAIVAIAKALAAQPAQQQEPAGAVYRYGEDSSGKPWHGIRWTASGLDLPDGTKLYTSPQPSKPLTDEQIMEMYNEPRSDAEMITFARAIEAAHGITGETK